jgi:5-methylcytosine-specific restriction endonuclease McrA
MRQYYLQNAERIKKQASIWGKKNLKRKLLSHQTEIDAVALLFLDKHKYGCAYCGSHDKLEMDHKIPRSKGGSSHASNLQWLCRKCNQAKDALTEEEFFAHIALILARRKE